MTESKNVSVKTIAVALIGAGLLAFIGNMQRITG